MHGKGGKGQRAGGFTMMGVEKEWNRDQGYVAETHNAHKYRR